MKAMSFEDFKKVFKDSNREEILKDFYYNYQLLVELKEYRRIIKQMTNDTYIEPNSKEKRFIDKVIELGAGEIIEDTPKEDKKIEKLSDELTYIKLVDNETFRKNVVKKINEIIDYINNQKPSITIEDANGNKIIGK